MRKRRLIPRIANELKLFTLVTTKVEKEAYYSNYAGNPPLFFHPGQIGYIGATDVSAVWTTDGLEDTFYCVDFFEEGDIRRCSLYSDEIVPVQGEMPYALWAKRQFEISNQLYDQSDPRWHMDYDRWAKVRDEIQEEKNRGKTN